jgi:hypothetical protein
MDLNQHKTSKRTSHEVDGLELILKIRLEIRKTRPTKIVIPYGLIRIRWNYGVF